MIQITLPRRFSLGPGGNIGFCDDDGLRDLGGSRLHFGAFLRNCVQIDQVGQVSVAPRTEARGRAIRIGPFIKEDREAVVPCTRNQ